MTDQYPRNNINDPIGSREISASATLTLDDGLVVVTTASGAVSVTLPIASQIPGQIITVKTGDAGSSGNAVTVLPPPGETIDGLASESLTDDQSFIVLQSDGSNWRVIGRSSVGSAPTTYRDVVHFGRNWTEDAIELFFETRGYFARSFSFEPEVIMIAPSSGRLLEVVLFTITAPGLSNISIYRPGTSVGTAYASVAENIALPTVSTNFDFSGETTELVKGERFSISYENTIASGITSATAVFEWDL